MRIRITIRAEHTVLPWHELLEPGRNVLYNTLKNVNPQLSQQLHERGIDDKGRTPLAYSPLHFPTAQRKRGEYRIGGTGHWDIASPDPTVIQSLAAGFALTSHIQWGSTPLELVSLSPLDPPNDQEETTFRATSPITLKRPHAPQDEPLWLLPGDPPWTAALTNGLQNKAAALELPTGVQVRDVPHVGPQRRIVIKTHEAGHSHAIGATATVTLTGHPETLTALRDWGLGHNNSSGFGWCA